MRGDASRVDVVAGTAFFQDGGERIKTAAIFIHPLYDPATNDYDVAIMRLASPSELGKAIPVTSNSPATGENAIVSGWGAITEGGRGSEELLFASIPIVDSTTCNLPESYNGQITQTMLCAGKRTGGLDSCQGDSGGPLVTKVSGNATLVGVVSWGEGCARELKYGVYANVASIASWLDAYAKPTKLATHN